MKKEFLDLLAEKLNTGSMRNIYLNALPSRYKARMDFFDIDKLKNAFSDEFFTNLFSEEKFELRINLSKYDEKDEALVNKIEYLYSENNNILREEGFNSFAIGYPILVKKNSKTQSFLKAPLFIWKLNIVRSKADTNEYIITKDEENIVGVNKVLMSHLMNDEKLDFSEISKMDLDDELFSIDQMKEIISKLNEKLKMGSTDVTTAEGKIIIEKFPSPEILESQASNAPFIQKSALLGLFMRQNEGVIEDFNNLRMNFDDFLFSVNNLDKFQIAGTNSSITTDPSQQNVVETLTDSQYKIIQGPPGTGKSQTLTAIITNALENGASMLVVCEKRTALEVIAAKLKELGLDDLVAVFDDPIKDRKTIVKRVRDMEEKLITPEKYDANKYSYSINEYKNLKTNYNNHHKILQKQIMVQQNNIAVKEIFDNLFTGEPQDKFYYIETKKINLDKIYKVQDNIKSLIARIGSMQKITEFENVYNNNFSKINSYDTFFTDTTESLKKIEQITVLITNGIAEHKDGFINNYGFNKFKVALLSVFNAKLRDIKDTWNEINKEDKVIEKYNKEYTNDKFTKHNYDKYMTELKLFSEKLNSISGSREEFIAFLESKKSDVLDNETKVFMENFKKETAQKNIKNVDEYLLASYYYSVLKDNNVKEDSYKDYSINLDKLVEFDNYVVENQKFRIKNYWYDIRSRALNIFANDNNIKAVYNLRKNAQFSKINTLREIISMDLGFFQKMFPVIMVDPDTCSAIFPLKEGIFDLVVFDEASQLKLEEVLPSLIRGKYKVISGDIHQMPPSNYFGAELERDPSAQDSEIDEESLYLADSESLLDFVNNLKEDTVMSYLDFHYRSKNPKLINFSNAAFYDSRLIPMPAKVEYIPINYYQINGEYKERKNISEADKIIEMIFSDEILIDGKVPGIGIVTLNQEQKDFINKRINKFLSENNDEKIKTRYNDLVEANMFVKNLENVQGDERDIMILSTTFGKTSEGRFIQNFGPVNNQTKGYRLLNVLVTRAKYKFIVLTSIPEENIQGWEKEIQSQGNNGKAVFYAYLAYAKAVSENNSETEARILNVLSKNKFTQNDSNAVYSSSNNSNIMRILKEKKLVSETDEVIKNYKIGGFNLDYAIRKQGEEKPKVVIDININDSFSQENVSYKAIIYRRNMFKNMGYEYHLLNATEYI